MLWPLAWLWAYSKPVLYKLAYGTDVVEPHEHEPPASAAAEYDEESTLPRAPGRGARTADRGRSDMEILLLGIYSFFVWLIFFKYKLLPWNTVSQVIVITLPIIGIAALILILNIVAPSSADVRVINYVVAINPRVNGLVTEVPIEPNRPIRKGDVLFRIDPTPFEIEVDGFRAQLRQLDAQLVTANAGQRGLAQQLRNASASKAAVASQLKLARVRVDQLRELARTGAGNQFDYEQAQTEVANLEAQLEAATASESQIREKLAAKTDEGEQDDIANVKAQIARAQAQLADAQWRLDQIGLSRAGERHRRFTGVAARRDGRAAADDAGDDLRRRRAMDHGDLQAERGSQDQAGPGSGDRTARCIRAASSSARSIRSCGRRPRVSCRSAAPALRPALRRSRPTASRFV